MKRKSIMRISVFMALLVSLTNFQCKKEAPDKFCEVKRTDYLEINNKEGMIVHSSKYEKYAVSFTVATSNNVDSQLIGFVCGLSTELKTIGLRVVVSGTLKRFNSNENITPEIAGQDLYFLEATQIAKKQ